MLCTRCRNRTLVNSELSWSDSPAKQCRLRHECCVSPVFRDVIDLVILELRDSGELERLYYKWFLNRDSRCPDNTYNVEVLSFSAFYIIIFFPLKSHEGYFTFTLNLHFVVWFVNKWKRSYLGVTLACGSGPKLEQSLQETKITNQLFYLSKKSTKFPPPRA